MSICRQPRKTTSNVLATKAITRMILVLHIFCNHFHPARANNHQEPLPTHWGTHTSHANTCYVIFNMVNNS